jgi:selenide,water dikinase
MCKGSNLAAVLDLDALPILDGAEECLRLGITSSLQPANVRLSRAVANQEEMASNPQYPLIYDPQTAGGLLAAVDADRVEACIEALKQGGYPATCIIGSTYAHLPKAASDPSQLVYVQDKLHQFSDSGESTTLVTPVDASCPIMPSKKAKFTSS